MKHWFWCAVTRAIPGCVFPLIALAIGWSSAEAKEAPNTAPASVLLWDTGKHSAQILTSAELEQKSGWRRIAGDSETISGDACLANDCLALVFRKGCPGAECYYRLGDKLVKGLELVLVGAGGERGKRIESLKVIDVASGFAHLEARSTAASGRELCARFLLKKNKPFVEVQPREGAEALRVEAHSDYAMLPDLFGADLVICAKDTQADELRFPSENMAMQLMADGNAILTCAWRSGDQKAKLMLDGAGEGRRLSAIEVECREEKVLPVWVGVLAAPGIWHQRKVGELNKVKDTPLDWKMPFPALWRADYRRTDGLIDSWKFIVKKREGEWEGYGCSPKKDGSVWHPTRGTFGYPARIAGDTACLRNTEYERLPNAKYKPDAAAVIYPYQKISRSPKNVYGVVDLVRETLEETPALAFADDIQVKRFPRDKFPGVCHTTGECEKIFDAKEEKAKKREIVERLGKMSFFIINVRSRIDEFMAWSKRTRAWCDSEKAAKPQLAGVIDELDGVVARFEKAYESFKLQERTPVAAHALVEKFIALVDSDEEKKDEKAKQLGKDEKAKQLGRDLRTIGGSQDNAIGTFRMIAKEARQRAGYRMVEAKDDASFDFAARSDNGLWKVLQNSFGVEGGFTD